MNSRVLLAKGCGLTMSFDCVCTQSYVPVYIYSKYVTKRVFVLAVFSVRTDNFVMERVQSRQSSFIL